MKLVAGITALFRTEGSSRACFTIDVKAFCKSKLFAAMEAGVNALILPLVNIVAPFRAVNSFTFFTQFTLVSYIADRALDQHPILPAFTRAIFSICPGWRYIKLFLTFNTLYFHMLLFGILDSISSNGFWHVEKSSTESERREIRGCSCRAAVW